MKFGNRKQQSAFKLLNTIHIFDILKKYNPILVGTIPIGIDIDSSDLDIICEVYNLEEFERLMKENFSCFNKFKIKKVNDEILIVNFLIDEFEIEVYAQNIKTTDQNGYRHMIIENRVLKLGEDLVREKVIDLKKSGLKTEPAFAKLLNLPGNPYDELLKLEELNDAEIRNLLDFTIE
ncbi:DUF4269 domain-containing protein [Clostridium sp. AL.422]|uniref:DUF4269 domain-containing protein n=1 Tax=Clostridium TaxID=1485 RepID=UPI00293DE591|nr:MULTISPECIES: DUF4269 domain-containing protein [unclassified Clostridium]MDV4149438.1 DUF4269 domain-containing protein [Clostridium sp. AL.422]